MEGVRFRTLAVRVVASGVGVGVGDGMGLKVS